MISCVGLVEEGEDAVGIRHARGVEVEIEIVFPVGLDRLEVGLRRSRPRFPRLCPSPKACLEAREDTVVRFLECIELVGLLESGLDFAVVVLRREFAADFGLFPIGVHVEGAGEPFALLAHLHAHVAGPGDVGALALVRVLDHRGECRLRARPRRPARSSSVAALRLNRSW